MKENGAFLQRKPVCESFQSEASMEQIKSLADSLAIFLMWTEWEDMRNRISGQRMQNIFPILNSKIRGPEQDPLSEGSSKLMMPFALVDKFWGPQTSHGLFQYTSFSLRLVNAGSFGSLQRDSFGTIGSRPKNWVSRRVLRRSWFSASTPWNLSCRYSRGFHQHCRWDHRSRIFPIQTITS